MVIIAQRPLLLRSGPCFCAAGNRQKAKGNRQKLIKSNEKVRIKTLPQKKPKKGPLHSCC